MDFSKYVGREYEKCNCFDLVKEFYSDFYGLQLKDYFEGPDVPQRKEIESLVVSNKGDFERVTGEKKLGDLIILRMFGYASHLGIYLENGQFLHSVKVRGSCIERVGKYSNMIEGFYRHRERNS